MRRRSALFAVVLSVMPGICDIQSGMVAHWAFDESDSLVAYDSSGNGFDLQLFSTSAVTRVKGISGGACLFSIPTAGPLRIDQGDTAFQTQQFTGAAWIRLAPGGSGGDIVSVNDVWMIRVENPPNRVSFIILNRVGPDSTWGVNGFQYYYLTFPLAPGTFLSDGAWHHVACTKSDTQTKVYFDGLLGVAQDTVLTHVAYPYQPKYRDTTTFRIAIGGHPYEPPYAIRDGIIDDVRVYNRALPAEDVAEMVRVTAPAKVTLSLPADTTTNARETISWSGAAGAGGYRITLDTMQGFFTPLLDTVVTDTFLTPDFDLPRQDVHVRVSTESDTDIVTLGVVKIRYVVQDFAVPFVPATTHVTTPTFRWHPVDGATSYRFAYGYDLLDSGVVTADTFFTPTAPLHYTSYSWIVYAQSPQGPISSGLQTVTILSQDRPVLLPVVPSPTSTVRPTLKWTEVPGATSYTVQISDIPFYTTFIDTANVTGTEYIPPIDLPYDTIYWRVRANTSSYTVFSPNESFIVSPTGAGQDVMGAHPASQGRTAPTRVRCQGTKSLIAVQGVPSGARVELFAASGQRLASAWEQGGTAVLRVPPHAAGLVFVRLAGAGLTVKTTPLVLR